MPQLCLLWAEIMLYELAFTQAPVVSLHLINLLQEGKGSNLSQS